MELQSPELTVEDILNFHRGWITELYVQDKKTATEIVALLHEERRLFVTLAQIQRCIEEWNLVQLPADAISIPSPSPTLSDDWEFGSTPPKSEAVPRTVPQASYTPSDPAQVFEYNQKPLPSIPTQKLAQKSSKIQKRRPSSTTDRLKLTCHRGPTLFDVHEVQTRLKLIPNGTSPIDRYTQDEQTHERIALGLDNEEKEEQEDEDVVMHPWRRAAVSKTTGPREEKRLRTMVETRRQKNNDDATNDELPASRESNGKRKREQKPQPSEDEQESPKRMKTPPSPSDEA